MKNVYHILIFSFIFFGMLTSQPSVLFGQAFDINQCNREENEQQCRNRLAEIEKEIQRLQGNIQNENQNQQKLTTEITQLNTNIQKTSTEITRKNNLITNIRNEITEKQENLGDLNARLEREKESLAKILRKRNELEGATLFEVILSRQQISDFYEDTASFSYVQGSLSDSFEIIDELKVQIYGQKSELERKQQEEDAERYNLQLEKNKIESQKKDRDQALNVSKQTAASYEELKKLREQEAAAIRAEMIKFQGSGVESRSISFGEAYDYAKLAQSKTGVDPAFIMAIMQQETGFGNNVGGCYLKNGETAEGIYIRTGNPSQRNMVPGNFDNFVRITSALGMDWRTTPISCALVQSDGTLYGHGGAMGYTQFIPNTWASVETRVKNNLGVAAVSPWNPRDAVMATAVFIQERGASGSPSTNYNAYYNAACRYYGACSSYATSVMNKTASIQTSISTIERAQ